MRALVACFTVFLGLGAMTALGATMAGCSDTSDAGSGGASGGPATTAGAPNAGGPSAGSGGGPACTFASTACNDCLMTSCGTQLAACVADAACKEAVQKLAPCACGGTAVDDCAATFAQDGGDPAFVLTECYSTMCMDSCQ